MCCYCKLDSCCQTWDIFYFFKYFVDFISFNIFLTSDVQSPLDGILTWALKTFLIIDLSFYNNMCFKWIIFLCFIIFLAGKIPSDRGVCGSTTHFCFLQRVANLFLYIFKNYCESKWSLFNCYFNKSERGID